jgi:hypothetical protein
MVLAFVDLGFQAQAPPPDFINSASLLRLYCIIDSWRSKDNNAPNYQLNVIEYWNVLHYCSSYGLIGLLQLVYNAATCLIP